MLEQKHFKRFRAMLHGELNVANLSDEEAIAFAGAIAKTENTAPPQTSEQASQYLREFMDRGDTGLDNQPKLLPEVIQSNAHNLRGSKKAHIPQDWKSLKQIQRENIGHSYVIKTIVLSVYDNKLMDDQLIKKTTAGHIYISSKYEDWLIEQGFLRPTKLAAPDVDSTWQSANALCLSRQYVGGDVVFNQRFSTFRDEQITCLQAGGMPFFQAEQWVEKNWIGTYRIKKTSQETLFASPEAIAAMQKEGLLTLIEDAAPLADTTWKSASALKKTEEYVGTRAAINSKFLTNQMEKMTTLETEGMPAADAKQWVEESWIGTYRDTISGKVALFASPEAIQAMKAKGVLRLKAYAAPDAKPDWQSANGLVTTDKYVGGNSTHQRNLWGKDHHAYDEHSVFGKLVRDITNSLNISDEKALRLAQEHLAELQKTAKGREATFFSMHLQRVAVDEGTLRRRDGKTDIADEEFPELKDLRAKAKQESPKKD